VSGAIAKAALPADDAVAIATQADYSCALRPGNELWCWGENNFDIFRQGSAADVLTPTQVPGISASQVALGDDHICIIDSADSSVKCWGSSIHGQAGIDRPFLHRSPAPTVLVCEP
jgi:alpha-tubulin suppressor-like RCC1 family protein